MIQQAIQLFDHAYERGEKDGIIQKAWTLTSNAQKEIKNKTFAAKYIETILLARKEGFFELDTNLCVIYFNQKKYKLAISICYSALKNPGQYAKEKLQYMFELLCRIYQEQNMGKELENLYVRGAEIGITLAMLILSSRPSATKDQKKLFSEAVEIIRKDPKIENHRNAILMIARIERKLRRAIDCQYIDIYQRADVLKNDMIEETLAYYFLHSGQTGIATRHFNKALHLTKNIKVKISSLLKLAQIHKNVAPKMTIHLLKQFLKISDKTTTYNDLVKLNIALLYTLKLNNLKEAEKYFKELLNKKSLHPTIKRRLYFEVGRFYFQSKKISDAITYFNLALKMGDHRVYFALGEISMRQGEYKEAMGYFQKALKNFPTFEQYIRNKLAYLNEKLYPTTVEETKKTSPRKIKKEMKIETMPSLDLLVIKPVIKNYQDISIKLTDAALMEQMRDHAKKIKECLTSLANGESTHSFERLNLSHAKIKFSVFSMRVSHTHRLVFKIDDGDMHNGVKAITIFGIETHYKNLKFSDKRDSFKWDNEDQV